MDPKIAQCPGRPTPAVVLILAAILLPLAATREAWMADRRRLVAGNWKMNGLTASLGELRRMAAGAAGVPFDVAVCPPSTLVGAAVATVAGSGVMIGGQDCAPQPSGAYTGDVAAEMIADLGGRLVIVGHSERRTLHSETDAVVRAKAEAAARAGLIAILCVGETAADRKAGATEAVLDRQLAGSVPPEANSGRLVIAYEPVWAIGTGLTPTTDEIAAAHAHIRRRLGRNIGAPEAANTRILYGGSVKADNANGIAGIPGVDGALVGGASLKAAEFLAIVAAFG
jgi:triosephosphate isomerase